MVMELWISCRWTLYGALVYKNIQTCVKQHFGITGKKIYWIDEPWRLDMRWPQMCWWLNGVWSVSCLGRVWVSAILLWRKWCIWMHLVDVKCLRCGRLFFLITKRRACSVPFLVWQQGNNRFGLLCRLLYPSLCLYTSQIIITIVSGYYLEIEKISFHEATPPHTLAHLGNLLQFASSRLELKWWALVLNLFHPQPFLTLHLNTRT